MGFKRLLNSQVTNSDRIGEFCENSPPRLCDHAHLQRSTATTSFRACTGRNETYVSWGSQLSLIEYAGESTAVTAVEFALHYEFVDTVQDGVKKKKGVEEEVSDEWSCDRVFDSSSYAMRRSNMVPFSTPRNVFLFGRGGRRDLRCSYTFVGRPGERVRLEIEDINVGGRAASSR